MGSRLGSDDAGERLHKVIAASGICSRRAAEDLIRAGRVQVNGEVVREMGVKVQPSDDVRVDGARVKPEAHAYIAMNKPVGYLTTLDDPRARRTILDLAPEVGARLRPVGRLDKDTEGLLILTNDGELASRLTHPRFGVEKEYVVKVRGVIGDESVAKLESGVPVDGRRTAPAKVFKLFRDAKRDSSAFHIVIHEGRNRQVRRMCEAVGHFVTGLKRTRIGPVHLGDLPRGASRLITKQELSELRNAVGIGDQPEKPSSPRTLAPASSTGRRASSARKRSKPR
jgi:23S rRNA pseudouridine2605 synthase